MSQFDRRHFRANFALLIGAGILTVIIVLIVIQFRKDTKINNVPPQSDLPLPETPEANPQPAPPPADQEPPKPIHMDP